MNMRKKSLLRNSKPKTNYKTPKEDSMRKIRKSLLKAITMLNAAISQSPNKTDRLMRMSGGIALAEMHIEEAKELLNKEMDEHEKAQHQKI